MPPTQVGSSPQANFVQAKFFRDAIYRPRTAFAKGFGRGTKLGGDGGHRDRRVHSQDRLFVTSTRGAGTRTLPSMIADGAADATECLRLADADPALRQFWWTSLS